MPLFMKNPINGKIIDNHDNPRFTYLSREKAKSRTALEAGTHLHVHDTWNSDYLLRLGNRSKWRQ